MYKILVFVGCCEKIIAGAENLLLINWFLSAGWVGLGGCLHWFRFSREPVSVAHWIFFVYYFPVYLPEVIFFFKVNPQAHLYYVKTRNPSKIILSPFSSLLMKEIQSERQQTAAPWDVVLTGLLTNPYSPARLSKCYPLFWCVDKQLGSTAASATGGENGQGLSEGAWQYFWQGQEQMRW